MTEDVTQGASGALEALGAWTTIDLSQALN